MEPVNLMILLKKDVDPELVKSELEKLAKQEPLTFSVRDTLIGPLLLFTATPETYKAIFGLELEHITREILNLNQGTQETGYWKVLAPAVVPDSLSTYINYVDIDRKIQLTD